MEALSSPFEALPVDYLRFGILPLVNKLWTWLAVVTAAVSFWRIRSIGGGAGGGGASSVEVTSEVQDAPIIPKVEKEESSSAMEKQFLLPKERKFSESSPGEDSGMTKGKFTWYIGSYVEVEWLTTAFELKGREIEEPEAKVWTDGDGEWWERVLRMKNGEGDGGWYRFQDLTVLNGNVVRLWEDNRFQY